ncbi:MAG: aryl sulfotransferase [Proteobacteria bacterium]|nr:aryl sulfotransferase [Pseudomonadota bacterium]
MGWSPFRRTGLTYLDSRSFRGYTLITPIGGDAVYLLNDIGHVVHQWRFPGFQPGYGYLLPGGNLLVRGQPMVEKVGIGEPAGETDILLELDWDANEVWRWEHESFHHDMCRLPNGNTLVLVWEVLPDEQAKRVRGGLPREQIERFKSEPGFFSFLLQGVGVGGRPRLEGMLVDAVWEINPQGEPVHIWHAYEHLNPDVDTLCPIDFPTSWTHLNAVELTPEGNVLISSQKLSIIMKIDWPKGTVLWKWGGPGFVSHQHDPTITPEGNLLVFDNGTHHPILGRSRVIEVDMETNEIVWQYVPSPVFSMLSAHIAGAERLANGNTLICEGESGRVFEVTRDCEICWEWVSPFVHDFKGIKAVMLFRAHRYAPDGPELEGRMIDGRGLEELNEKWGLDRNA